LTVSPITVASPDITRGDDAELRQDGQIGDGGCTNVSHSSHPWMRSRPSWPYVQNHSLHGSKRGRGREVIGAPSDRCERASASD